LSQSGSQRSGKCFVDDAKVETELRKWLRRESKDFSAAGFDALVTRWGNCNRMNVAGGYAEKYMFFFPGTSDILYPFVTYLLCLPRMWYRHNSAWFYDINSTEFGILFQKANHLEELRGLLVHSSKLHHHSFTLYLFIYLFIYLFFFFFFFFLHLWMNIWHEF
jgi:hypothetical protein